jgi:hypothetical protein
LDAYAQLDEDRAQLFVQSEEESELIGFRDAVFAWSNESGVLTPSKRKFRLCIDDEVYFQPGRINLVVGPTGSGKTSVLMALLGEVVRPSIWMSLIGHSGEMHFMPSGPTSWFNLPRKEGVAYAAQESWIQNETIRVRGRRKKRYACAEVALRTIFFSAHPTMRFDTRRVSIDLYYLRRLLMRWCSLTPVCFGARPYFVRSR